MWILIYGLFIMFYFFVILDPGNKTGSIFLQPIFKVFGFDPKEHGINDFGKCFKKFCINLNFF